MRWCSPIALFYTCKVLYTSTWINTLKDSIFHAPNRIAPNNLLISNNCLPHTRYP